MHRTHAQRVATIVGFAVWSNSAVAQEAPPKVVTAADAKLDNKTTAAMKMDASKRPPGWTPGIALGASFNLLDAREVVGQQSGTTITMGGALDGVLDFNEDIHEWRNGLQASLGTARTPSLEEFVKTNDGLAFHSTYLLHVVEMFGPFARFQLNSQMLPALDIRTAAVDYAITNLDGSVDNYTGRRLALTDPFQPLALKESLGAFLQPIRSRPIELEARLGVAAQQTLAEGGLAIADDEATPQVEVKELDDNHLIGAELVANAWGFFDESKRVSYSVGIGVLQPFFTSDLPAGDDRGLGDLTNLEGTVGLNAKLFDWASIGYRLDVKRQPLLVDAWQVQNNVLLTIGAAFGSKAPAAPPPKVKPKPCACDEVKTSDAKPDAKPEAASQPKPTPEDMPKPTPTTPPAPKAAAAAAPNPEAASGPKPATPPADDEKEAP